MPRKKEISGIAQIRLDLKTAQTWSRRKLLQWIVSIIVFVVCFVYLPLAIVFERILEQFRIQNGEPVVTYHNHFGSMTFVGLSFGTLFVLMLRRYIPFPLKPKLVIAFVLVPTACTPFWNHHIRGLLHENYVQCGEGYSNNRGHVDRTYALSADLCPDFDIDFGTRAIYPFRSMSDWQEIRRAEALAAPPSDQEAR